MSDFTGTPNNCFLWNLFGEAKIAQNFLDDCSIHAQFSKLIYLINSLRFSVFHSPG